MVLNQEDSQSQGSQTAVITAGDQSGETQVRILWVANFSFLLNEIRTQNQWEHKSMRS